MDVKTYAVALDIMCSTLDAEARAERRRCEDSCPLMRYGCGSIDDYDRKTLANLEGVQKEIVRFFDERGWIIPNLAGIRGQHKGPCERPGAPQSGFNSKGIHEVREAPQTPLKTNSGRFEGKAQGRNTPSERAGAPGRGLDGFTGINRPTGEKNAAEGECGDLRMLSIGEVVQERGGGMVGAIDEVRKTPGSPITYGVVFEGGKRGSYTADNLALIPDNPTFKQAIERLSEYLSQAGFCFPGNDEEDADRPGLFPQDTEPNEYRYLDPGWLDEVARGLTSGAVKHPGETWREIPAEEHLARAMRHINLFQKGDRSEPHIINASMRLMMAYAVNLKKEAAEQDFIERMRQKQA